MAVVHPVYVEVLSKTNMNEGRFKINLFEMRSRTPRPLLSDNGAVNYTVNENGICKLTGCVHTSVPAVLLRLKAVHLFIPTEARELVVCENPNGQNEMPFQNDRFSPFTARITDGNETIVYHIG